MHQRCRKTRRLSAQGIKKLKLVHKRHSTRLMSPKNHHPESIRRCIIDAPPGWLGLIEEMGLQLDQLKLQDCRVERISERWGRMVCSLNHADTQASDIVARHEKSSASVCMLCSKPAALCCEASGRWIATLCDSCAKNQGFHEL